MAISKTQRWLDLIAFLAKRRTPVSVEEIMAAVPAYALDWETEDETKRASVRRKFERDKDELRSAGIPLETVPYTIDFGAETVHGYALSGKDFYLPYLRIVGEGAAPVVGTRGGAAVEVTQDDARLAMDALRRVADLPGSPFAAEARSALAKLRFDLMPAEAAEAAEAAEPDELAEPLEVVEPVRRQTLSREAPDYAPPPVVYAGEAGAGATDARDTLRLLTEALRGRRRVRFRYHGIQRGEATERDVAPYGLLHQQGHWYLVGHDATRDAIRVFRLGRMEGASATRGAPEYDPDPDFDLSAYARRQPWELGEDAPVSVDVRFDFPLSLWAERNAHGEEVSREAGGVVVRRFEVRQAGTFLRWLQAFGGDAVVTSPPALRAGQARLARETLALYGEARGG